MFRPSPSPLYTSYSTIYSPQSPHITFDYHQESSGGDSLRHDSGGPSLLTGPFFDFGAAGLGTSFSSNTASLNFTSVNDRLASRQLQSPSSLRRSSHSNMDATSNHGYEAQQQASSLYAPTLEGPMVGEKKSSHAITDEYARADPIYVAKTAALPQTYSHYRPVLGDGNCGWRAIIFNYFEKLQKLGNRSQIQGEIRRMQDMSAVLTSTLNLDPMIFDSMQEIVIELLQEVMNTLHLGPFSDDTNSPILRRFNEKQDSDSIVYWFRLLASSWLVMSREVYAGFIPDGSDVDSYRQRVLMPSFSEIDHLGMTLLIDVLLKPIGIATEVVYLDRSPGSQVNTHTFQELDENNNPVNPHAPTIYLLYRPGHYDILYKDVVPLQPEIPQQPLSVHRVHSIGQQDSSWTSTPSSAFNGSNFDFNLLAGIPGMSYSNPSSHGFSELGSYEMPSTTYDISLNNAYSMASPVTNQHSNSPISPIGGSGFSSTSLPVHSMPQSNSPISTHPLAPPINPINNQNMSPATSSSSSVNKPGIQNSILGSHSLNQMHRQSSFSSAHSPFSPTTLPSSPHTLSPLPQPQPTERTGQIIRQSKYTIEAEYQQPPPPPQTHPFRESNFNPAHYRNEVFQPEQWQPSPEDMCVDRKSGGEKDGSEKTGRQRGGHRGGTDKGGNTKQGRRKSG